MGKDDIIKYFPNLKNDSQFKISSPETPDYNCIAWAFHQYNDVWMQPPDPLIPLLDGVTWWPDGATPSMDVSSLEEAFQFGSFVRCDSWEHENGFIKVALYYKSDTNEWTHASRESRSGKFWMSKLEPSHDIYHGTPFTIEGECYGQVYCFMKKPDE